MATLEEAVAADTPLGSDLAEGVRTLALEQTVVFTQYVRLVLPIDGFVFWIRADLLGPSALLNVMKLNAVTLNQPPLVKAAAPTFDCKGSLHYSTEVRQEEAETYAANRVVFTSLQSVNDLNAVAPGTLWVGQIENEEGTRFAFSSRSSFYRQADLWHYVGFAVYPDMATQLVDDLAGFDAQNVVVSNSLPAWLALNGYAPAYGFATGVTLFPSFLSPENLTPPFGTVHVAPETTRGLAAAPRITPGTSSHYQLCAERVKITLWGTRNYNALDFVDAVNQYSLDTGIFGLMNTPVIQDEKRTQSELATIAMKKSITYEISYHQSRMRQVGQQLIESAVPNFFVNGLDA